MARRSRSSFIVRDSLVVALQAVFLMGALVSLIAFVANFFLKEIPLRKRQVQAEVIEAISPEGAFATGHAASEGAAND